MEDVFIQKVYQLNDQLFKQEVTPEYILIELDAHLKKAHQMQFHLHETETLNAIGLTYSFMGKSDNALHHFKLALEKAEMYQYVDLICKLCNNICKVLQNIGELEAAIPYANKGIAIMDAHQLKLLPILYLYNTKSSLLILLGDYSEATITLDKAWDFSNQVEFKNYSRFSFGRAIYSLHLARLYIHIYNHDENQYQETLKSILSLKDQIKSYSEEILVMAELVHAIATNQGEAIIYMYEQKLTNLHQGAISLANLHNMTIYLTHNHCHTWAKKYAQQILDRTQDDPETNFRFIQHAQNVLAGTFS